MKPALDEQALDKRLLRDFEKYANHDFCNALDDLLPQKLIGAVVERTEIPPHEKVHDVTREQRHRQDYYYESYGGILFGRGSSGIFM